MEGNYQESETRLNQALQFFKGIGTHWQTGRTLKELAELALVQTETTQAQGYLSQALTAFEEIKAAPDAARTRQALQSLDYVMRDTFPLTFPISLTPSIFIRITPNHRFFLIGNSSVTLR